jgi:hypothetical protein
MLVSPCGKLLSNVAKTVFDNTEWAVPLFNQIDCELELIDSLSLAQNLEFQNSLNGRKRHQLVSLKREGTDCANVGCGGLFQPPNTFRVDPQVVTADGTLQFIGVDEGPLKGDLQWVPSSSNSAHNATFKMLNLILANYTQWCTFLPTPNGDSDNGLQFIKNNNQLSTGTPTGNSMMRGTKCLAACQWILQKYQHDLAMYTNRYSEDNSGNGAGQLFQKYPLSKAEGSCSFGGALAPEALIHKMSEAIDGAYASQFYQKLLVDHNYHRGAFLDSSASTYLIPMWVNNPRTETYIYFPPGCDYKGEPRKNKKPNGEYYFPQDLDCFNTPTKYGTIEEIVGLVTPSGKPGWTSWNDFFSRHIRIGEPGSAQEGTVPSRPVTQPKGSGEYLGCPDNKPCPLADQSLPGMPSATESYDYVVSAPTDCIMNPLYELMTEEDSFNYPSNGQYGGVRRVATNFLSEGAIVDVKGHPISWKALLGNAPKAIKARFEGGSGIVCILMPNTYHNYHSPVDGVIEFAELMKLGDTVGDSTNPNKNKVQGVYGAFDFPNFDPARIGNVAGASTDHSTWNDFQRSIVIVNVTYHGACDPNGRNCRKLTCHVASINVGLDTVGSVTFSPEIKRGARVKRAVTRVGGFYYGGSMNLMFFSKTYETNKACAFASVKARMGDQIAQLSDTLEGYENPFFGPAGIDPIDGASYAWGAASPGAYDQGPPAKVQYPAAQE